MPSLRELWRSVFPQARPFPAAGPALDRPVAWVRVLKARVPAFDALEAHDLAIVQHGTLDSLRALGVEPGSVIEAVATAGASGVLLVGQALPGSLETQELLQRSAARGLAALLLANGDVAALERSTIAYIVTGEAELERRVAELESELEAAALAGAGMPGLAGIIARFLARPVAIEAGDGTLLAVHAPTDAQDEAGGLADYLQRRRGEVLRLPLPPAAGGQAVRRQAALVLLGSAPTSELDLLAARRIVGLLALELGRGPAPGAGHGRELLPADGPPWVVIVARQLDDAKPSTFEQRERVRAALQRSEPVSRLLLRGDASSLELRAVAAAPADDPHGLALADRVARRLGRPVAVSQPFSEPLERATMEAHARLTLEALEALSAAERASLADREGLLVGRSELAAAYRLLASLPALPDGLRHARRLLAPLLDGRPARDRRVLDTLRAALEHDGLAEAAAALGIHRNTLAYRLARIEEQTGWRLSDARLRFTLALAVRLLQSSEEHRTAIDRS
ncbi:MAG TPA: helix-turn-helix domain-containing protein [Candidatus Limnocylindria bacterium]|nr:helix-turn-helix domain-containing protein [Candidatus Limnocylindria bacterium]